MIREVSKADAILSLVPTAQFSIVGAGLEGVVTWVDPVEPPVTEEQIKAEYDRLVQEAPAEAVKAQRADAYRQESDPLFFMAQRREATEAEWLAKIEEIRQRYPYPVKA